MINQQNYFTSIGEYLPSLDSSLLKGHNLIVTITSNGDDWEPYFESENFKRIFNLYFEKLNNFVSSQKKTDRIKNNTTQYPKEPVTKVQSEYKAPAIKQVDRSNKEKGSKSKKIKRETRNPVNTGASKPVEKITDAIRLIQRYVGLHNKKRSVQSLYPFIKAVQKAILEKRVRKADKFGPMINTIQQSLIKIYNSHTNKAKEIGLSIDEPALSSYVKAAGGEKVYKSISYIKRFIGMQGTKDLEKMERFIKSLFNSDISDDDPYADKINEIKRIVMKAHSDKKEIHFTTQELNGLNCIVEKCGCQNKAMGEIYRRPEKNTRKCRSGKYSDAGAGACSYNKGLKKKGLGNIMSLGEAAERQYDVIYLKDKWNRYLGNQEEGFVMMLHGEPSSGKSSLLIEFAYYLATNHGPVLYATSEEFDSLTFKKKLNLVPRFPEGSDSTNTLTGWDLNNYKFVIIDSITDMDLSYQSFKNLKEQYPAVSFIFILQHNKDGSFQGSKKWEHLADVVGSVANYTLTISKNRSGPTGEHNFYDPTKKNLN